MSGEQSVTRWMIGLIVLGLGLRLGAAVVVEQIVSQTPGRLCLIEGDAEGYWELGRRLARGEAYELYDPPRRILRMPGFPVLIAASQLVFGDRVFPVRCLLAVIGTFGCWGVFLLGRELVNPQVGLLACAGVSLSPPLTAFSPLLLTETSFGTALVFSLLPVVRLCRQTAPGTVRWMAALGTGVWMALASYVRPTWLPVTAAAALAVLLSGQFRKPRWVEAVLILGACGAALAPWTWRNYQVSGHLIPTTLWVGPSLYDGLNPQATGDSDMAFFDRENLLRQMSEYEMDREYRRRAWEFAAENPGRALQLAVVKAGRYWSPWPNAAQFRQPLIMAGLLLPTLLLYVAALRGIWLRRSDLLFLAVTVGPALFFCLIHLLFVGSIRYRLPADMVLWIAAAVGGVDWAARLPWSSRWPWTSQHQAPHTFPPEPAA